MLAVQSRSYDPNSDPGFPTIPAPWTTLPPAVEVPELPGWPFPLDPGHELAASPEHQMLAAAGPVEEALLTATTGHVSIIRPILNPVAFLLQEELRLEDTPDHRLRDQVRGAIAWLGVANALTADI